MKYAVIFSKLVNRGAVSIPDTDITQAVQDRIFTNPLKNFAEGTYTLQADLYPEAGKTITCMIQTFDSVGEHVIEIPESGEGTLPYTFTLERMSKVKIYFGYRGWRSAAYGGGDPISRNAVSNIRVTEYGKPEKEIYEHRALHPDEISDSCTITWAMCSKTAVTLQIPECAEAFGYPERTLTLVRIMNLDGGMLFKGRVTIVSTKIDNSGKTMQEVTCVSAIDFLEDTTFTDRIEKYNILPDGTQKLRTLEKWLTDTLGSHNYQVDRQRKLELIYGLYSDPTPVVSSNGDYICSSIYSIISDVLTGGKYLSDYYESEHGIQDGLTLEWCEGITNDVAALIINRWFGITSDTPFLIGDNIGTITVERNLDGGIYTSVLALSGINGDGCRHEVTAINGEMFKKYGDGRQLIVQNDDIKFTGSGGWTYYNGSWVYNVTPAVEVMDSNLRAFAKKEAAKLSEPPVKISLTAYDLAMMGFTGYEPFAVYDQHHVVCPQAGLYGQKARITGIRRRLSDGRVEQLVIESGWKPKIPKTPGIIG